MPDPKAPYWQLRVTHDGPTGEWPTKHKYRRIEVHYVDENNWDRNMWVFLSEEDTERVGLDPSKGLSPREMNINTWVNGPKPSPFPKAFLLELFYEILERPFNHPNKWRGLKHYV